MPSQHHLILRLELHAERDGHPLDVQRLGAPLPIVLKPGGQEGKEVFDALVLEHCEDPSGRRSCYRVRSQILGYDSGWRLFYAEGGLALETSGPTGVRRCAAALELAPELDALLDANMPAQTRCSLRAARAGEDPSRRCAESSEHAN